jgi:hypothetical protein
MEISANISISKVTKAKQFFTLVYTISTLILTIFFLGSSNIFALRVLYPFTCGLTLLFRIEEFYRKGFILFFVELCYFLFVWTAVAVACGFDVRYVYPFLQGPLIWFSLINGESYSFHNLNRVTSFIIHNFGAFVTCCIYLNYDDDKIFHIRDIRTNFYPYFKICMIIFACWYFCFSVFLFGYNGTEITLLRHKFKVPKDEQTPLKLKLQYFFGYPILMVLGLCFGIVSMHVKEITYAMFVLSISFAIIQTGWYYYVDGDTKNKLTLEKFVIILSEVK